MDHFYYDFFFFYSYWRLKPQSLFSFIILQRFFKSLAIVLPFAHISHSSVCTQKKTCCDLATIWAFCRRLKALKGDQLQSCSVRLAFSNTHSFVTHLVEFLYSPDQQWVTGGVFEINIICEERKKQLLVLFTHLQSVSDRQHLLSCSHTCWGLPDCFRD